jgi:predicted DNA-binding transcriptional regulator AlpA
METNTITASKGPAPLAPMADLIPYRDVAGLLGMSRTTLDKLAGDAFSGFPPRLRLGSLLYISRSGLEEWLRSSLEVAWPDANKI